MAKPKKNVELFVEIENYINQYKEKYSGASPSVRELADALGELALVKACELRLHFLFIKELKRRIVDDLGRADDAILCQINFRHRNTSFF